jgi:hypothetical protein
MTTDVIRAEQPVLGVGHAAGSQFCASLAVADAADLCC